VCGVLPVAAACGKKGPPLPPLQVSPARVEDLKARRLGEDVYLSFTVPTKNSDGKAPADVATVEGLGLTGEPVDRAGRSLAGKDLALESTVFAKTEIAPPPERENKKARRKREEAEFDAKKQGLPPPPPASAPPPDPRPKQGDPITFVETMTPALAANVYVPRVGKPLLPIKPSKDADTHPMPVMAKEVNRLHRIYTVAGRSKKGHLGPLSARIAVPFDDPPPVPPPPVLTYTDKSISVKWEVPAGARLPVQQAAEPDSLPVRILFPVGVPHTFNVYERAPDGATGTAAAQPKMPKPLNDTPLSTTSYDDARVEFGKERCYVVRTVEASGTLLTIESAPSPPACVTPVDTFPPAAPVGLAAVGSEGAINLIWESSGEADIAGYLVMRGEAAGGPLAALTPEPIHETTFRDTGVRSGKRYVYAVVAVDGAKNVSAESNRVEETAR
jgi:hypothetical protein